MTLIVGMDEAGRGPVIGPMVMCGVLVDSEDEQKLANIGVKDSKLILPNKREELFDMIIGIVKRYVILIRSPEEIDAALLDPNTNLNWLEADTSAEILNELKPEKAILDCPSNNPAAYKKYVKEKLDPENSGMEIVAEHKADVKYPVVSAASILAKVTRDREIEKIKEKYGDVGSGYPADPKTKEFLLKNYKSHPEIFRRTWQSYKNVVAKGEQKGLVDF